MSTDALELALALHQAPIQRFSLRDRPLPENIDEALQLASEMQPQLEMTAARFQESEATIVEAVRFYLHQVLFEPGTDAYRILGLTPQADIKQIRQHHIWLQRWLHPDRRGEDWEAVFTTKVNWAWQQLRNETSRGEYNQTRLDSVPDLEIVDDGEALVQAPAWNTQPIESNPRSWPRRITIGGLLVLCAGLFYLAASIEDRVDPISFPQQTEDVNASAQADFPLAAEAAQQSEDEFSTSSEERSAKALEEDQNPEGAIFTESDASIAPLIDDRDLAQAGLSVAPAAATIEALKADPERRRSSKDSPASEAGRTVMADGSVGARLDDPASIAENDVGNRIAPQKAVERVAATPTPGHVASRASRDAGMPTEPDPAVVTVGPGKAAVSANSGRKSNGELPAIARQGEGGRAQHRDRSDRAPRVVDIPQGRKAATEDAVGAEPARFAARTNASSNLQAESAGAVEAERSPPQSLGTLPRFELARKRVRSLVSYFRSEKEDFAEWKDDQGQLAAELERDALQERLGRVSIDRFALDPPAWRVSDTIVAMQASYRVNANRAVIESGKFNLDMAWREGGWKITRIEMLPSP